MACLLPISRRASRWPPRWEVRGPGRVSNEEALAYVHAREREGWPLGEVRGGGRKGRGVKLGAKEVKNGMHESWTRIYPYC